MHFTGFMLSTSVMFLNTLSTSMGAGGSWLSWALTEGSDISEGPPGWTSLITLNVDGSSSAHSAIWRCLEVPAQDFRDFSSLALILYPIHMKDCCTLLSRKVKCSTWGHHYDECAFHPVSVCLVPSGNTAEGSTVFVHRAHKDALYSHVPLQYAGLPFSHISSILSHQYLTHDCHFVGSSSCCCWFNIY